MLLLSADPLTPVLKDHTIVVKNLEPESWQGRKFDIGLYKNSRLFIKEPLVHVGDQVNFVQKPIISFAISRNMHVGKAFTAVELSSNLASFNLTEYPNGLIVTLTAEGSGEEYMFTPTPMA